MSQATPLTGSLDAQALKACCAAVYQSDWAKLLLGDSLHPGGLSLTDRLGDLLGLGPEHQVLDAAAGTGSSAIYLAQRFGCQVVGVDYSAQLVVEANERATAAGLAGRVRFEQGDVEALPFAGDTFDAILCECAFCTFPDKETAAAEFGRLLKPGGRIGLSDLTRTGSLPAELDNLLAWVACIADARPAVEYATTLQEAGFDIERIEPHDAALQEAVMDARTRLLGAELLIKLKQLALPGGDFAQAKRIARHAMTAVKEGKLGYAIIIGRNEFGP